jgi:hypothetical protein
MKHRLDGAAMVGEEIEQLLRRQDVGQLSFGDVAPLVALAEVVAEHQVGAAARLEGGQQVGADEAGPAGDDDHEDADPVRNRRPL